MKFSECFLAFNRQWPTGKTASNIWELSPYTIKTNIRKRKESFVNKSKEKHKVTLCLKVWSHAKDFCKIGLCKSACICTITSLYYERSSTNPNMQNWNFTHFREEAYLKFCFLNLKNLKEENIVCRRTWSIVVRGFEGLWIKIIII